MGQFSSPVRITATWPTMANGPWMPLYPGATTVTLHFSDQQTVGSNAAVFARLYWSASSSGASPVQVGSQTATFGGGDFPKDWDFDVSGYTDGYVAGFMGSNTSGNTNSALISYSDELVFCEWGTQKVASSDGIVILDPNTLLNILSFIKSTTRWNIVSLLLGEALDTNTLCAVARPAEPIFSSDDVWHLITGTDPPHHEAILTKARRWLQWAAWPLYCECAPGATTPVPYPNYPAAPIPGLPAGPQIPLVCDESDICTQLGQLSLAVNALGQKLQQTTQLVTLIQRQAVPFAFVDGTVHAGLSGSGEFAVQGILGLRINFTTIPARLGRNFSDPQDLYELGTVALGAEDAWLRHERLSHSPHLVLGVSGAATRVAYALGGGVVATITELVREA